MNKLLKFLNVFKTRRDATRSRGVQPSLPKVPSLVLASLVHQNFLEHQPRDLKSSPQRSLPIQHRNLSPQIAIAMGKGKGKAGRKTEKAAARAARKEKLPGVPKPAKPLKKEKVKKPKTVNPNPPGSESFSIPMGQSKPLTKTPQHVKWPALFKKHLGVIEAHIRSLDRAMQSMKSQMGGLDEKERLEWELGETGNWRVICEMMDRAREVLANARKCADGIVSIFSLYMCSSGGI